MSRVTEMVAGLNSIVVELVVVVFLMAQEQSCKIAQVSQTWSNLDANRIGKTTWC